MTTGLLELGLKQTRKLDYLAIIVSRTGPARYVGGIRDQFGHVIYEHAHEVCKSKNARQSTKKWKRKVKEIEKKGRKEMLQFSFLTPSLVSISVFGFRCLIPKRPHAFRWETAIFQSLPYFVTNPRRPQSSREKGLDTDIAKSVLVVHQRPWKTILNLTEFCKSIC